MLISGVMAAAAVLGTPGYVPAKLYRMKDGDTIAQVAKLNSTGYERLLDANPGVQPSTIRPGAVILVPARLPKQAVPHGTVAATSKGSIYVVRNGDNDWSIAARVGVSAKQLRVLNPGVNWKSLQIGQALKVPGTSSPSPQATTRVASNTAPQASLPPKTRPFGKTTTVAVRDGDNDWVIASRNGIKPSELRRLNPGVDWKKIKPGQRLNVPHRGGESAAQGGTRVASIKTKRVAIAKDSVRMRSGGKTSASVVTVAAKGQVGSILDRVGDWYKVSLGGETGWVRGDMLKPVKASALVEQPRPSRPSGAVAKASTGQRIVITRDSVNIRASGSMGARVAAQADRGEGARVLDRQGEWLKVRLASGATGWIRGDMAVAEARRTSRPRNDRVAQNSSRPSSQRVAQNRRPAAAAPSRVASSQRRSIVRESEPVQRVASTAGGRGLLSTASSMLGTRYRWGGTSRSGVDCSGFTSMVYRQHGVRLPRTSIEQSRTGQRVSPGELKQGDLVFFKTRGNRVSHVGMYVGNGKFIHASSGRGRVRVDSLSSSYYSRRFAGARRVKDVPQGQAAPALSAGGSSRSGSRSSRTSRSAVLPAPHEASAQRSAAGSERQRQAEHEDRQEMRRAEEQLQSEPRADRVQPGTAVSGG